MSGVHHSSWLEPRREGGHHPAHGRGEGRHEGRRDAWLLPGLLGLLLHHLLLGEGGQGQGRMPPGRERRDRRDRRQLRHRVV